MSLSQSLDKVRKPRIHIKYEVETEESTTSKELPFVVGVIADLAGNNSPSQSKPLSERKFIQIDQDNFDQVMHKIKPGASFKVTNTLSNKQGDWQVNLQFNSMHDFHPENLIKQIEPLNQLKQSRDRLRDLLSKSDRSEELEQFLQQLLQDNQAIQQLAQEVNL